MKQERDERSAFPSPASEDRGCARLRGRLEELHDGGLDPVEEARDRGHLEACAACRAESEAYRELVGSLSTALQAAGLDAALASSLQGLEQHLSERGGPRRLTSVARTSVASTDVVGALRRRRPALLAAAAAILLAFVLDRAGLPDAWSAVSSLEEVPGLPRVGELPGWSEFLGTDPEAAR